MSKNVTVTVPEQGQSTVKDALTGLRNTAKAVVNGVRDLIHTVSARQPDIRPAPGEYTAELEALHMGDPTTVKQQDGTETIEDSLLLTLIVSDDKRRYRVFYRNPISWCKRDFPRIPGWFEIGGIKAVIEKPEILRTLKCQVEITHQGVFTNVRIVGTAARSPAEIKRLMEVAADLDI